MTYDHIGSVDGLAAMVCAAMLTFAFARICNEGLNERSERQLYKWEFWVSFVLFIAVMLLRSFLVMPNQ